MGCIFIASGLIALVASLGLGRFCLSQRQIHLLSNRPSSRRGYVVKVWVVALVLLAAAGAAGTRMSRIDPHSRVLLWMALIGAAAGFPLGALSARDNPETEEPSR